MPEPRPLPRRELERILGQLEPVSERSLVLVGGQAVAFWAEYLSRSGLEIPVFATKDIDFEGGRTIAQRAGRLLDAKVKLPRASDRTPLTRVVVFVDSDGQERELDFIEAPRGLTARDVRGAWSEGLIAENHTRPFTAQRLVITEETVKTHMRRVFKKLDVHHRRAVRRGASRCL